MDPEDSWQQHAADTLKESYLLGDPRTTEIVTRGAARGIDDLERYGMAFAREHDGRISQRFFGAHKFRRTAFAGDYTGLEIQRTLVRRGAAADTGAGGRVHHADPHPRGRGVRGVRLRSEGRHAVPGARGRGDPGGGRAHPDLAAHVVAAGREHRRLLPARRGSGARLRDPELVQFHPSGIIEPENAAGTLVSEAARGEGGMLRNALGERYMSRYDPERMELSTRDRVALASYTEIKEGRGTENGGVWLDVSTCPGRRS